MAEIVTASVVKSVDSLLYYEASCLGNTREEILKIQDEMKSIQWFLRDADEADDYDESMMTWVKQLREIAYDIEDILDELKIYLVQHDQRSILQKVFLLPKNLKFRHRLVSSVRSIKSKMGLIHLILDAREKYRVFVNPCREKDSSTSAKQMSFNYRRSDALLLDETDLVGIERPKKLLIESLVKDKKSELKVISVVGMGGLGKTTLAKVVYDDVAVREVFHHRAWVTVSTSFKIEDVLKDIARQLFSKDIPEGVESMSNLQLIAVINKFLRRGRFLLVLDDVWSADVWDAVKSALPNEHYGRVMVTTRNRAVADATYRMGIEGRIYEMAPLSPEDSMQLFWRKAFQMEPCPSHLKTVSSNLVKKCEGLPLAIATIGGLMATKDRNEETWEMVLRSLHAELLENDFLMDTAKVLSLSYHYLPYYLKPCLMYFCMFPENYPIGHKRLIRLWMAEGFIQEREGLTLEEAGEYYLKELVNRSLIQVAETTSDGRIKTYSIHDLLRDIILWKSKEQSFLETVDGREISRLVRVRRLSLYDSSQSGKLIGDATHLRSLFMFQGLDSSLQPPNFELLSRRHNKLLRVLDMGISSLNKFPIEVRNMVLLRYLSLRYTKLKRIPDFIGKLQQLETLDLKHSLVTELPVGIVKIQKLRHLLVYRYEIGAYPHFHFKHGFVSPVVLKGFQSLQTLCFMEAADRDIIRELGMLVQLRRLGIIKLKKDDGKDLCSSIEKLRNLHSLSVTSKEENEIIDMQGISSPPPYLQRLYLSGCLERLPNWISSLYSLQKLHLTWSRLRDSPIESLQHLPNLIHLGFIQAYDGMELCFKSGGFYKLKVLSLDRMDQLEMVELEEGALPSLEELIFQRCKLLRHVQGIENLSHLKVLTFSDMPEELVMALPSSEKDGEHWKVAHVPKVSISS